MVVTIFECIPIEVSLPIFASILIFVAGVCVNYIAERWKIYRQRDNLRKNVIVFLDGLIDMLKEYDISLQTLSNAISTSDDWRVESFSYVNLPISYLDRFDVNQVSDALLHGVRGYTMHGDIIRRNFYQYHVHIEYIKVAKEHIEKKYDEYKKNVDALMAKWIPAWDSLGKNVDKHNLMGEELPCEEREKYKRIRPLISDFVGKYKEKGLPLKELEVFIDNILEIINDSYGGNWDYLKEINYTMVRLLQERKNMNLYGEKFGEYAQNFVTSTAKLEEILNFYKGCKTRLL